MPNIANVSIQDSDAIQAKLTLLVLNVLRRKLTNLLMMPLVATQDVEINYLSAVSRQGGLKMEFWAGIAIALTLIGVGVFLLVKNSKKYRVVLKDILKDEADKHLGE